MLVLLCCMHIFNRILSLKFLSTPKAVCQAGFLLLVRARCEHHFQISYSILSCWWLEISNGRNVYTTEIVKCSKSGLFFFFGPDGQFFKFTNILLPTYHSLKITLVKVTNDHKFATSNRHLFSFYLTPQPHWIQLIMSSFLKCFPQFNSKASLSWFSNYFTDHFFLVPWPISFYLSNL